MDFRVLGPLEVYEDGRPVPLPGAKCRALLALLLLRGDEIVTVDSLIDGMWGESPPATARKAVQVYVSTLRKELGPERIATRPAGYTIALEPDELDLHRFERLLGEGKAKLAAGDAAAARDLLGSRSAYGTAPLSPISPSSRSRRWRPCGSTSCAWRRWKSESRPTWRWAATPRWSASSKG
jgi:DNA-binding SARP family transcriptional activator